MGSKRKMTDNERHLLSTLVVKANLKLSDNSVNSTLVENMEDGSMGSLILYPPDYLGASRNFGRQASDIIFQDTDGVNCIATLYLDENDKPFELDIWKTDFSPLIQLPYVAPSE